MIIIIVKVRSIISSLLLLLLLLGGGGGVRGGASGSDLSSYIQSWSSEGIKDKVIMYRTSDDGFKLNCGAESHCWRPMVTTHWPHLLNYYNISLKEK